LSFIIALYFVFIRPFLMLSSSFLYFESICPFFSNTFFYRPSFCMSLSFFDFNCNLSVLYYRPLLCIFLSFFYAYYNFYCNSYLSLSFIIPLLLCISLSFFAFHFIFHCYNSGLYHRTLHCVSLCPLYSFCPCPVMEKFHKIGIL
jgi:hypothetical protein